MKCDTCERGAAALRNARDAVAELRRMVAIYFRTWDEIGDVESQMAFLPSFAQSLEGHARVMALYAARYRGAGR